MITQQPKTTSHITVGADKGYDTEGFVKELRQINVTPHVAQNNTRKKSAIDGRTNRSSELHHKPADQKTDKRRLWLDEDDRKAEKSHVPGHRKDCQAT